MFSSIWLCVNSDPSSSPISSCISWICTAIYQIDYLSNFCVRTQVRQIDKLGRGKSSMLMISIRNRWNRSVRSFVLEHFVNTLTFLITTSGSTIGGMRRRIGGWASSSSVTGARVGWWCGATWGGHVRLVRRGLVSSSPVELEAVLLCPCWARCATTWIKKSQRKTKTETIPGGPAFVNDKEIEARALLPHLGAESGHIVFHCREHHRLHQVRWLQHTGEPQATSGVPGEPVELVLDVLKRMWNRETVRPGQEWPLCVEDAPQSRMVAAVR